MSANHHLTLLHHRRNESQHSMSRILKTLNNTLHYICQRSINCHQGIADKAVDYGASTFDKISFKVLREGETLVGIVFGGPTGTRFIINTTIGAGHRWDKGKRTSCC
ncbi:UNVERIFIED_CONTAM: hypothetical protein Sindi_0386800 [Sesamum indicum]